MSASQEPKMIPIKELEGKEFYIESYQRGYRWTPVQVRYLLEDINEAIEEGDGKEKFYCLQPVTVLNKNNKCEVIDGQQRLTTLYLIFRYFNKEPFSLEYYWGKGNGENDEGKWLKIIKDDKKTHDERQKEFNELGKSDIDCFYIAQAYKTICNFFQGKEKNDVADYFKVSIIWYELQSDNAIDMFSKINTGSIRLTNGELIKALLLKSTNGDMSTYQAHIVLKWDDIEAQFSDPEFCSFLMRANEEDDYVSRIDFIFKLVADELVNGDADKNEFKKNLQEYDKDIDMWSNMDCYSFNIFQEYIKYLEDKKGNDWDKSLKCIWGKVEEYYRMFMDWYRKRSWYHKIGFILECGFKNTLDLCKEYRDGFKTEFEEELNNIIQKKFYDNIEEKFFGGQDVYNEENKEKIRRVLLLYNLAVYEIIVGDNSRFSFNKYKHQRWDIEHITAVNDRLPAMDERAEWLELAWEFIGVMEEDKRNEILEKLKGKLSGLDTQIHGEWEKWDKDNWSKEVKSKDFDDTFKCIFSIIVEYFGGSDDADNSIRNLTLLEEGINRGYKNAIFPVKRRWILREAYQQEKDKIDGRKYIPICTRMVFLKAYIQSQSLLLWDKKDKDAYQNDMKSKISQFLGKY